jgi:hypothetical protein
VPSRARSSCVDVGDELLVDGVGDASLEAAQCLGWLLPGSSLAAVVGPAVGVEPQLGDRGDVDHVIDPPVPGSGESVPVLLT